MIPFSKAVFPTLFPLKSVTVGQYFMLSKNLTLIITKDSPSNKKIPHATQIPNSVIALVLTCSYGAPVFK